MIGWDDWRYYRRVLVNTNDVPLSFAIATNYTINMTINTSLLVSDGKLQSSCNDLLILDNNYISVPRKIINPNSSATTIFWRIPTLTHGIYTYYTIYGNTKASSPDIIPHSSYHGGYYGKVFSSYEDWIEHPINSTTITPYVLNFVGAAHKISNGMLLVDPEISGIRSLRGSVIGSSTAWPGGFMIRIRTQGVIDKDHSITILGPSFNQLIYVNIGSPTTGKGRLYIRTILETTFDIDESSMNEIMIIGSRNPNGIWDAGGGGAGGGGGILPGGKRGVIPL